MKYTMRSRLLSRVLTLALLLSLVPAALAAEDIRAVAAALYNSFERAVPPDSAVWDIESALRAHGALAALLSGSGSAVFGLFAREDTARAAAETLRERWPMTFAAQPV